MGKKDDKMDIVQRGREKLQLLLAAPIRIPFP